MTSKGVWNKLTSLSRYQDFYRRSQDREVVNFNKFMVYKVDKDNADVTSAFVKPHLLDREATENSKAVQDARNQNFSSSPEFGLPKSKLSTSGSKGQSGRIDPTRFPRKPVAKYLRSPRTKFPGKAVVKCTERNVTRIQKKAGVISLKRIAWWAWCTWTGTCSTWLRCSCTGMMSYRARTGT